jgi:ABC-type spermidine/putrescine transport system permease subunit II
VNTDAIFWLSPLTMIALWIATFVFARRRRKVSKMIAFYLGMFVVWPALTLSFGLLLSQSALEGVDKPVGPGVAYIFLAASALTLLVWLGGYAVASIAGWFVERRAEPHSPSSSEHQGHAVP